MKLAISNIAWLPEENTAVLRVLQALGVAGIEVAPTLLFDNPAEQPDHAIMEVRRFWADNGIDIVAMQSLLFGHPEFNLFGEESNRRAMIEYLKGIIALGGKLGARALVFGSPKNRLVGPLSEELAFAIAVQFFAEIAAISSEHGTCFCIEPNARDYGCDFVTDMAQAQRLVAAVNHPGFGLHADAGVLTMNSEPYGETLENALPHMRHFHISEPFLMKITDAKTNHEELGRQLRRLDYRGWVSIEMRNGLGDSNVRVVEEALRYAIGTYIG